MAMREDFCAFILSHGRPDRVHTYKTLLRAGYTGKVFIVIDDEDESEDEYRRIYGDKVLQFCKADYAAKLDDQHDIRQGSHVRSCATSWLPVLHSVG